MKDFSAFMQDQILLFSCNGQFGTAHVHSCTLKSVETFAGRSISFETISPEFLKSYELWLRSRQLSWNTVSTYLRAIRSVYNRAIAEGMAVYRPQLFRMVFTGVKADVKRSLDRKGLARFFSGSMPQNVRLGRVSCMARLMFMLRGMPFVDMAYLQKNDLCGNVITYRRRKTGRLLTVTVTAGAMKLLRSLRCRDSRSPFLFPILRSGSAAEVYNLYRRALRRFNRGLDTIRRSMGLVQRVSSYTIRHTWGTMAYRCEIHPGIICEALGHSSVKVTETYLKPFNTGRIDEANRLVLKAVRSIAKGHGI